MTQPLLDGMVLLHPFPTQNRSDIGSHEIQNERIFSLRLGGGHRIGRAEKHIVAVEDGHLSGDSLGVENRHVDSGQVAFRFAQSISN